MTLALAFLLAAAPAQGLCLDPDESTQMGRILLDRGVPCERRAAVKPRPRASTPAALPLARQQAILRYFDAKLFDGASARWKWPKQQRDRDMYCGWVNARNRLGGYTGWTAYFVSFDDSGRVEHDVMFVDATGVMTEVFSGVCTRDGYDVVNPPLD